MQSIRQYALEIIDLDVVRHETQAGGELLVTYRGQGGEQQVREPVADLSPPGLLAGCEAVARRIFHTEFRMSNQVSLGFSLESENGMSLWHTKPQLYVKCPLTMAMQWSCDHLNQSYKTMTTLGIIELPDTTGLQGNALGPRETARVMMESMASGVEFMGNLMLMREGINHEAEVQRGLVE